MDLFLLVLGAFFLIIGFLGSILPILPGPPISWVGLLLMHFTKYADFTITFLIITGVITLIITLLDYFLPMITTKKFGGSKASERGAMIGTIVGIFLGPIGIIVGPFIGALIGEYMTNPKDSKKAFKAALGSFIGFLLSTGIKLMWCMFLIFWYIKELF